MTAFEFVFALFGLILGLSIVEMLGGLARALKAHGSVRIGWLTPLLGILVLLNLLAFWYGAWGLRDDGERLDQGSLLMPLLLSGAYYLAAAMIFPDPGKEPADLDDHFMANKRVVLVAIGLCNLVGMVVSAVYAESLPINWWIVNPLFLAAMGATAFAATRRASLAGLVALLVIQTFAMLA